MTAAAKTLTGIVCLLHFYFLILEMFLWTTPFGLKTFNMTQETADSSAVLAANQGLYNGFLAVGLLATFFLKNEIAASTLRRFCLLCVIVAGAYGAVTVGLKILFIQGLPAIIAFGLWQKIEMGSQKA
jgi:putative membrane protein